MSVTKIIKGWVAPSMQLDTEDFGIIELLDHPAKHGDVTQPATLYIGPGKLWTEEEVRAMLGDVGLIASGSYRPKWLVELAAKHGLTL